MAKIISCKPIGKHQTYDLEVEHPDHQFYMSNGILTSNSHAAAYAYLSYQCSYLLNYYEPEWIQAVLETDEDRDKILKDVASIGYRINKPDVNFSGMSWLVKDKNVYPRLDSLKGIGEAGGSEIVYYREKSGGKFKSFHDFLFDGEGNWRWSKMNKKILEALIKSEAFESLEVVGPGKLFDNYRHMLNAISENFDGIKNGKVTLEEVSKNCEDRKDYTKKEKLLNQKEMTGVYDHSLLFDKKVLNFLAEFDVLPLGDVSENLHLHWFILHKVETRKTKNGKPYFKLTIGDTDESTKSLNYFGKMEEAWELESIYVAPLHMNNNFLNVQFGREIQLVTGQ